MMTPAVVLCSQLLAMLEAAEAQLLDAVLNRADRNLADALETVRRIEEAITAAAEDLAAEMQADGISHGRDAAGDTEAVVLMILAGAQEELSDLAAEVGRAKAAMSSLELALYRLEELLPVVPADQTDPNEVESHRQICAGTATAVRELLDEYARHQPALVH